MAATLYPYAVAVGGILALMAVWLLVQRAWGRTFAVVDDVLAERGGCGSCVHEDHCGRALLDGVCGEGADDSPAQRGDTRLSQGRVERRPAHHRKAGRDAPG